MIENVPDGAIDIDLDQQIRGLLSECFGSGFSGSRSPNGAPIARFLMRDNGALIAHLACHAKTLICAGRIYLTLGVSEACVRPDHRGRGVLKALLSDMHAALPSEYAFSLLFGYSKFYQSSGYVNVANLSNCIGETYSEVMVRELTAQVRWPTSSVHLVGARF